MYNIPLHINADLGEGVENEGQLIPFFIVL